VKYDVDRYSKGEKMSDTQSKSLSLKHIALLVLIAIVIAVVATLLQSLLLGRSSVPVTSGVVAAITVGLGWSIMKKRSGQ